MNARDALLAEYHFFGVVARVFTAVLVADQPIGIDAQGELRILIQQIADDLRCEQNVRVAANEPLVHHIFRMQDKQGQGNRDV